MVSWVRVLMVVILAWFVSLAERLVVLKRPVTRERRPVDTGVDVSLGRRQEEGMGGCTGAGDFEVEKHLL